MRGNKRCLKNKDAKLASAKQLSVLFLLACVVSYLQFTCLEVNYVDQSLKGLSNSSNSPSVCVCLCNYRLWPLKSATSCSNMHRWLEKNDSDTKQEQNFIESVPSRAEQAHPITFFIWLRQASSARCTTEKAQNCQEGANRWGQLEGVRGWREWAHKIKQITFYITEKHKFTRI